MNTAIVNNVPRELPIAMISESPTNPRRVFDEAFLKELASSIDSQGVLASLLVRPKSNAVSSPDSLESSLVGEESAMPDKFSFLLLHFFQRPDSSTAPCHPYRARRIAEELDRSTNSSDGTSRL
jgi:hypothetical protein